MEFWTAVTWGLVVVPALGMTIVLADVTAAYRDLIIVDLFDADPIEHEQVKHELWSQAARAGVLAIIAVIALLSLVSVLTRGWLAVFVYGIALVITLDAWRARQSRKRMVAIVSRAYEDS